MGALSKVYCKHVSTRNFFLKKRKEKVVIYIVYNYHIGPHQQGIEEDGAEPRHDVYIFEVVVWGMPSQR